MIQPDMKVPFTLRERSWNCKTQWNSSNSSSTSNTCSHRSCKTRWNSINSTYTRNRWKLAVTSYNGGTIRTWSEHDPRMTRGRSATVVPQSLTCQVRSHSLYWTTQHFVRPLSLENAFCTRLPSKVHVEHLQNEAIILRDFLPKCMLKSWLELELARAGAVETRILYTTSFQNACWTPANRSHSARLPPKM